MYKNNNAGMSNDKQCKKHCRRKFKVFGVRIILFRVKRPLRKNVWKLYLMGFIYYFLFIKYQN